jgi:hypothetical protein
MHEKFRRRLEALEELAKLRSGPTQIRHIAFVRADGSPVDATIARGPSNFICRRAIGEELEAFKSRASDECRAIRWRVPPILVFLTEEASDAARS